MTTKERLLEFLSENPQLTTPEQAARVEAMRKVAGKLGAFAVAGGSNPATEAEALSQDWLARSLKCAAASRRDSAEGRETHAWCNEVRSATYLLCADELRQRMGLTTSRQPESNNQGQPRPTEHQQSQ